AIARSALIGIGPKGAQQAVLCYELKPGIGKLRRERHDELTAIATLFPHTARITTFLHYPKPFPVDIRHNAKISREVLAAWAATQLKDGA
ncbi:MAG: peptide synthase, partial [Thermomonas sp.]